MSDAWFGFSLYRLSMLFLLAFLLFFLVLRYSRVVSLGIALGCFVLTTLLDYFTYFVWNQSDSSLWMTGLQILLVQGTAFLLSRYRDARALFTGVTAATYVLVGNILSEALHMLGANGAALAVGAGVQLALLVAFVRLLRTDYLTVLENDEKNWASLTTLPALFYAAMYALTTWPGNIEKTPTNWLAAFLLLALLAAAYLLLIKIYTRQNTEAELQRSRELLDTYAKSMRHELETVRRAEAQLAACRHDIRHVDRMLLNYLENGEPEKAAALLNRQEKSLDSSTPASYCENVALNSILTGTAAAAAEKQIAFRCRALVPATLENVNEFELGIVVMNLLENALHAAAVVADPADRLVTARLFPVKAQLMVEITNSFAGNRHFSKKSGLPESGRGAGHGYGLRNVQAFADKNNAFFKLRAENGEFKVQLMVKM